MELVIRGLVPLSYNSKNKAVYQKKIRSAFLRKYKGVVPTFPANEELYARVYFFTSDGVNVDSDNIKNKISNYEKAKGNINQAIVNLQSIRNTRHFSWITSSARMLWDIVLLRDSVPTVRRIRITDLRRSPTELSAECL